MKYAAYILCLFTSLLLLAGCDDASPYMNSDWKLSINARYLSVDKAEVSFGADQNLTQQLHVSAVATGWNLSGADSWVTASTTSGNADTDVTLTATENKSGDDIRTTIMTLSSSESDYNYTKPISITQSRANPYINPNLQTLNFGRDASSQTISVEANTQWQASCDQEWVSISIDQDKHSLQISVTENFSTTERSAVVTLKGNATTTIIVKQAGSSFDDLVATLVYGNKASSQEVSIETNGKWSASTQEGWISLSPSSGNKSSKLTISVKDNSNESERIGTVTVTVGSTDKRILVTQAGTYFTINTSPTDAIPSKGGSHAISFVSSDKWTAESNSNWVSLIPPSGQKGESVLTIKANDNASIKERFDTTFIVIDNAYLQPYRIITRQEGRYLSVSTSALEFYKDASSKTFTVSTDGVYDVKTSDSWLQCTKTGNTVKVTASSNTNPLPRNTTIEVWLSDVPKGEQSASKKIISVTQQGEGWKLDVDKQNIATGANAANETFNITSNDDWTAQSSVSWATLSSTQGNGNKAITISFSANNQAEKRSGTITIKASHIPTSKTIAIGQSGIGYYLELSRDNIVTGPAAGESSFSITSNDNWSVSSSVPSWATVSPLTGKGNGNVTVKFQPNNGPEDRVGTITVSGNNSAPQTVSLKQQGVGYNLSVSTTSLTADSKAATKSFSITSNDSWTVTPSVSWITVSPSAGSGNKTISVNISASNEAESRSGQIVVAGVKSDPVTIDVVQTGIGYYLEVDKTQLTMSSEASSSTFSISSNDNWTISSTESWATVSAASGKGDKTITVSCTKNNTNAPRTCNLTIKGNKSQTATIRISQDGYNLSVDKTEISVGTAATSSAFTITSNDSWTISSSVSWATVSTTSGNGNKSVSVNFTTNSAPESRSGIITVKGNNTPAVTISLHQDGVGYNLSVDKSNITVGAAGATESFTITSNDSWTVSSSASWAKPSPMSGSANKTITIDVERNTNTNEREATITIQGNNSGRKVTVKITQAKGGQNDITREDFEDPVPLN